MPEYRRVYISGGTYFFTAVTFGRKPILASRISRDILRMAWQYTNELHPFITEAFCIMPDHIHCIWRLPDGDDNYSVRWKIIKRFFSKQYNLVFGKARPNSKSQEKRGEGIVWQRRFWEHVIRDETDLHNHLNYIHYNPVKHLYVNQVKDWPWSSFHEYVRLGFYEKKWGSGMEKSEESEFGE